MYPRRCASAWPDVLEMPAAGIGRMRSCRIFLTWSGRISGRHARTDGLELRHQLDDLARRSPTASIPVHRSRQPLHRARSDSHHWMRPSAPTRSVDDGSGRQRRPSGERALLDGAVIVTKDEDFTRQSEGWERSRLRWRPSADGLSGRRSYGAAHRGGLLDPGFDGVMGVFQRFDVGGAIRHAAGKIGHGGQISAAVAFAQGLNDDGEARVIHRSLLWGLTLIWRATPYGIVAKAHRLFHQRNGFRGRRDFGDRRVARRSTRTARNPRSQVFALLRSPGSSRGGLRQ